MSPNDDFLYALKDDLPQDFADDLRQQLQTHEKNKTVKPARSWWVLAAATFASLFFGALMIFVSAPQIDFLAPILNLREEPLQLEPIHADNITRLEMIDSKGQGQAYRMALSPDNQSLAISTNTGIHLHDANDLSAEAQFIGTPGIGGVLHMEYADNGDLYVIGWIEIEKVGIYRWERESEQFQLIEYLDADWRIQSIDLSPDGNYLLYSTCAGEGGWYPALTLFLVCTGPATVEIHILDLRDFSNNITISPEKSSNVAVSMSPDWSQLAYYNNGVIYLYDMATGETRPVIETRIGTILPDYPDARNSAMLHFTPDGNQLGFLRVSTGKFHSWSLEELNTVDIENPFTLLTDAPTEDDLYASSIIFHPVSNERLLVRSDSIVVYPADDERQITELRHVGQVRNLLMNSDGSRLYVMGTTGVVQVLDWESRERIEINLNYSTGYNSEITFSQDSTSFVNNNFTYNPGISFLWDVENNALERYTLANDEQIANPIAHSAISPDSRYIAYAMSGYIYIYDRIENEHRQLYLLANVHSMGFRDDGQLVVISRENVNGGGGHIHHFTAGMIEGGDIDYPLEYAVISDLRFGNDQGFPATTSTLLPGADILAVFQCDVFVESTSFNMNCNQHLIKLVDTETGEILLEFEAPIGITFISLELGHSNDGQYLFMGNCERGSTSLIQCREDSGIVDIWRIEDLLAGNTEALRVSDVQATEDNIDLIAYDDGSFLLATSTWEVVDEENDIRDSFIYFHSISANGAVEEVHRVQGDSVQFSPDKEHMILVVDGEYQLQAVVSED